MPKFRPVRGGFAEAMARVVEVADLAGLARLPDMPRPVGSRPPITADSLKVEPYGATLSERFDARNGWDTHIVIAEGWGPVGYTDGPLERNGG